METTRTCPYNCDYKVKCRAAHDYLNDNCPISILRKKAEQANGYLSLEKCLDNHVYMMDARNGMVGIFDIEKKGFHYRRFKLGHYFLDIEYHWDAELEFFFNGNPMKGTAKPVEDLGPAPIFKDDKEKELYLMSKTFELVG